MQAREWKHRSVSIEGAFVAITFVVLLGGKTPTGPSTWIRIGLSPIKSKCYSIYLNIPGPESLGRAIRKMLVMSLPMNGNLQSSTKLLAYSTIILALPFCIAAIDSAGGPTLWLTLVGHAIFIREAGFSWDTLLTFGPVTVASIGGLFLAMRNLTMTKLQQYARYGIHPEGLY